MLSLYTTENVLTEIYLSQDEDDLSIWYSFITKDNLCSELYVKFNVDTDYEDNTENPVFSLAHNQNIPVNNLTFLSQVINLTIKEINNPFAVFLLDISPELAKKISSKYGVICHSLQKDPKSNPLFIESLDINILQNKKGKDWNYLLSPDSVLPSNSVIVVDRYLFANKGTYGESEGLENIYNILNNLLPYTLEIEYHVLIVFDFTKNDTRSESTFSKIATKINKLKQKLNREYSIMIETMSIDSNNGFYSDTHNRRIVSNYFIIRADHSLKAFKNSIGTCTQVISFDWAASKGIISSKRSDLPAKSLFSVIEGIKNAIDQYKESKDPDKVDFSQNGRSIPIKYIKNRLINPYAND